MNIIAKIEEAKEQILPHLYEWAETFNPENNIYNKNNIDEKEEEALKKSYEYVLSLTQRLENNLCNENDYTDILFHIEQINYNEIIIIL